MLGDTPAQASPLRIAVTVMALSMVVVSLSRLLISRQHTSQIVGTTTPNLSWISADGSKHQFSELRGQVVMLHFWAKWCAPCLSEMPSLAAFESRQKNLPFTLLALHVDPVSRDQLAFLPLSDYPANLILNFDRSALDSLDVTGIPVTFIIDTHGRIRHVLRGPQNWSSPRVESWIRTLIGEQMSTGLEQAAR